MPECEYSYSLTFRTPVSVFSGLGIAGLMDRTVVRDSKGVPYIPGSTVKGRLRFFAERLLRTTAVPPEYSIHKLDQPACKDIQTACTFCRIFGSPAISAQLSVGQAVLESRWSELFAQLLHVNRNPVVRSDTEVRPGIALSRLRRTAFPDHLFFDEAVPAIAFAGKLFLHTDRDLHFLISVGKLVDALGARKAVGRGSLTGGVCIKGPTL